jgi:RNA polymerase sigma factor (sigma-70 family)
VERQEWDPRLSQITTQWSMIFQAREGPTDLANAAQAELMSRYSGAVHRYLLASLRDADAAGDLNQEFALRFLRGDFRRADPARGRFRDFVKQALRNLMIDHYRRKKTLPQSLSALELPEAAESSDLDEDASAEFDRRFLESWRAELLQRAWTALSKLQQETGQPYYTVLKLRVDHPELHSAEIADRLSFELGRVVTAGALRQALLRARGRYVSFLVDEVRSSLDAPSRAEILEELADLRLLEYCKPALKRLGLS